MAELAASDAVSRFKKASASVRDVNDLTTKLVSKRGYGVLKVQAGLTGGSSEALDLGEAVGPVVIYARFVANTYGVELDTRFPLPF